MSLRRPRASMGFDEEVAQGHPPSRAASPGPAPGSFTIAHWVSQGGQQGSPRRQQSPPPPPQGNDFGIYSEYTGSMSQGTQQFQQQPPIKEAYASPPQFLELGRGRSPPPTESTYSSPLRKGFNSPQRQDTTPPRESKARGESRELLSMQQRSPLQERNMGEKPLSLQDEGAQCAAMLEELRALSAKVAAVLTGQNEIRSSLKLHSLNISPHRGDNIVGDGVCGVHGITMEIVDSPRLPPPSTMGAVFKAAAPQPQATPRDSMASAASMASVASMGSLQSGEEGPKKSRSSFNALRTEAEDLEELQNVFSRSEKIQAEIEERKHWMQRMTHMTKQEKDLTFDSVAGIFIALNAAFIGYSVDATPSQKATLFLGDIVFCIVFLLELIVKLRVNGCREHFYGEGRVWNIFDFVLILMDTLQLMILQLFPAVLTSEMPAASLFRVVRLARLARMLRLLRIAAFEELIEMVGGLMGGMMTLFWAMLLYVFAVYILSVVFREMLGHRQVDNVFEYFSDVPRSMFTVFRCSFGDCSSSGGVPIFEHVDIHYGTAYSLIYCVFVFSMTIGLFNVISAIFVESTLAAATAMKFKQKKARLRDDDLWATRISTLEIYALDVSVHIMHDVAKDPEAKQALDDLDIDPEDHEHLAEILDPDQGGSIAVIELIDGIKRLRGDPKRSDIVQIDLMLRSIMGAIQDVQATLKPPAASAAPTAVTTPR
eukprot:TRINITY_DN824_c0_g3_i1.p1 TRINITY_DN824_c0_g3~~TRINITY_DN824_c0_g3_i1.p1  ORF type:complete len:713 (-),score=210.03 TRINITY_DN824_c0_g3_i1:187-2325(-)